MMNFCMAFWTDGQENSTRVRNVKLTWQYLKDMVSYMNAKGIACSANLFDFSPEKIIDDSTHIPYPLGVYKRAEKLNRIIDLFPDNENIGLMDCDIFIHKSQWDNLAEIVNDVKSDSGYFFNFAKIEYNITTPLDEIPIDTPHSLVFHKGYVGAFGGLCLCPINVIQQCGGYDDKKFTTWGGEDGDLMIRFQKNGYHRVEIKEETVLPFHLPHFEDRQSILYYNGEEYVRNL
jgi:hypothetical protein